MVCSVKRAGGAAAHSGSAKKREETGRTLHKYTFNIGTYEEPVFVVDRVRGRDGGATGVFERHPATHARRTECGGVLVAGREAADFSEHAAAVPVRPDVHHECRWRRSAPGFDGQRGHHLRLFSERQPAHCLRVDAPGRRCLPYARGPQQGLRVGVYAGFDVFLATDKGNIEKRLTDTAGYDAEATVNWKTGTVVYTSLASGDLDLWTMRADGSNKKQITKTTGYDGGATFSDRKS